MRAQEMHTFALSCCLLMSSGPYYVELLRYILADHKPGQGTEQWHWPAAPFGWEDAWLTSSGEASSPYRAFR